MRIASGGDVGVGTTSPTAALHLKAGTSSAGGAPLKLTAGTSLSSPESGAIEYDGTSLYYTDGASVRHTLAAAGAGLTALSGDVSASGSGSVTATVTRVNGVTYGSSPSNNTVPVVTAANTVTYGSSSECGASEQFDDSRYYKHRACTTASSLAALDSVGLGVNGATTGTLTMANGASGGATTTVQPSTSTMAAWTFVLPSNKGTSGYVLQTDGSGNTSWTSVSGGTVTSVNMSVPSILSVSGRPGHFFRHFGGLVGKRKCQPYLRGTHFRRRRDSIVPFAGCRRHSVSAQRLATKQFSHHRIHFGLAWWDCDFAGCSQ